MMTINKKNQRRYSYDAADSDLIELSQLEGNKSEMIVYQYFPDRSNNKERTVSKISYMAGGGEVNINEDSEMSNTAREDTTR